MNIFSSFLESLVFLLISTIAGGSLFFLYNHFPPAWFIDYSDQEKNNKNTSSLMKKVPDGVLFISIFVIFSFLFFSIYGYSLTLICHILSFIFILLISTADIKTGIIPNPLVIGMIFTSLFWMVNDMFAVQSAEKLWYEIFTTRIMSAIIGAVILFLIAKLGVLLFKKEGMGMGDVKFIFACGLLVDMDGIFIVVILSFLLAFIPSIICAIKKRKSTGSIPFGPFISAATVIYLVLPNEFASIISWYGDFFN